MDCTRRLSLLIMAGVILNASAGLAATYHVAKSGSNNNSCTQATSPSFPKQTINAGIACLVAGDTLLVGDGTYAEILTNPFTNTGTSWTQKIAVRAQNARQVTLMPPDATHREHMIGLGLSSQQYIEFDGIVVNSNWTTTYTVLMWDAVNHIRFKNGALLRGADQGVGMSTAGAGLPDFIEFINMEIAYVAMNEDGTLRPCLAGAGADGTGRGLCHAFYFGGNHVLLDHCYAHHLNGITIHAYPRGLNQFLTVTHTTITDNYGPAFYLDGDNATITNNLVYNNLGGFAIGANNAQIYNNTVYNNQSSSGFGSLTIEGAGHDVRNNIFYNNFPNGPRDWSGNPVTLDQTNLVGTDPQFVDTANKNFKLKAISPAIDAGTTLSLVTTDINGIARPQGARYDIGAYEAGDTIPPNPPLNLRVN